MFGGCTLLNAVHLSKASNKNALDVSVFFSYIFLSSDLLRCLVLEGFIPEQDGLNQPSLLAI